jgi:hypothetical protein
MRDENPNSWEARADTHSMYGFTDFTDDRRAWSYNPNPR